MQHNILSKYYKLQPYMYNIELTTLYTTMHRENFFVDPAIYSDHVDDDAPCRTITEVDGWVVVDWNAVCANGNINKQLFSRGKHAHRAVVGLRRQRYAFIAYFRIKNKKRFRTAYFLLIFEKVILHWLSIKECVEFLLYHYGARITTPVGPVITGSLPADE